MKRKRTSSGNKKYKKRIVYKGRVLGPTNKARSFRKKRKSKRMSKPTQYTIAQKNYKAKSVKNRVGRKGMKIPSKVRQAIKEVIRGDKHVATYELRVMGGGLPYSGILTNKQGVYPEFGAINTGYWWQFSVDKLFNFFNIPLSRMWPGATQQNYDDATIYGPNWTGRQPIWGTVYNNTIDIISCGTAYEYKNNSVRTVYVDLYVLKPRKAYTFNYIDQSRGWASVGDSAYTSAVKDQTLRVGNPIDEWAESVTTDKEQDAVQHGAGAVYARDTFGNKPTRSPNLAVKFKVAKVKSMVLEPGQVGHYYLKGPSNVKIDLKKCFDDGTYFNIQPYTRGMIVIVRMDNVAGSENGFGRIASTGAGTGLSIERRESYKWAAIDQNITRDCHFYDVFANANAGSAVEPTDENMITT